MPLRFPEPTPETDHYPLTIGRMLDAALVIASDQEIVYRDQVRMTYRDLRVRIGRLASALTALGADQGTTVAVMDWDSHRYLECYYAIPMMGAVLQTVNVRMSTAQLEYSMRQSGAEILLCHRDFYPLAAAVLPSLPGIRAVIAIDDGVGDPLPPYAAGEYEALLEKADPDFPFVDFDENALATTFHTTGTTGDPKGVCFTHRQLVLLTLTAKGGFGTTGAIGLGCDDVYMPLTPMFHVHAWSMPYQATLLGLKQVYPGRYDPTLICRLRETEGVSYSHGVPTILQMVLTAAEATGTDLSGWTMTIGGSALTRALLLQAQQMGMLVHAGYGMSETGPSITVARRRPRIVESEEAAAESLTLAGVPLPLVTVRIVDEDMRQLPHDGVSRGELVVRAPWLTPCYMGNEAASAALWRGGWLHTQDVATIDAEGRVAIVDRLKDVIKTGGEWVSSLDLEDIVADVQGVAEVAVIGLPDARWGERPVALVVPRPGEQPTLESVNIRIEAAVASGVISRYARLDRLEIVAELPRTSVGKVDKKLLRATLAAAL
ncbi:long-chain fatty acid--CoA ligase [Sphingobium sp. 22B]|uniref:long-chain-fatty-acid--CoA ligase n=1 Tax=unclassified Sphingobium TaxID=2611147 RepID=UPI000781F8B7|nr:MULTISPECIES: long-chain-fatty-acid--CoA ligase [unclassified Sphingobium]KXU32695.1 long-chain fatty acid--CoA ligase [Sphingobium sp. AM]KYC32773.1 long-chain fatty acid--CoA ligase [Sphingobium sp. 22B]OAP31663.1 long-chain fatty acid--CoA ligase [Sphingobium sp. 20006FA]